MSTGHRITGDIAATCETCTAATCVTAMHRFCQPDALAYWVQAAAGRSDEELHARGAAGSDRGSACAHV